MKEISEVNLKDLQLDGEYLFVYSDRFNIFFFFYNTKEEALYKITTDKLLTVEHLDKINIPSDFNEFVKIRFFKPVRTDNYDYIFIGLVQFEDKTYKFKIDVLRDLTYADETVYNQDNFVINSLESVKPIEINSYIQKKNKLYITGYDTIYEEYLFCVVNIIDDKIERVYYMNSDYGVIVPNSINIDSDEGHIHVVGKLERLNNDDELVKIEPFFETFNI